MTRRFGAPPIDDQTYSQVREAHAQHRPVWSGLRHARGLPGGERYQGPEGEGRFLEDDHTAAEAGTDMVANAQRASSQSRAARAAAVQGRRLDDAITKGKNPAERKRLLDSAISEGTRQLDQARFAR